ncbi:MAG: ATP-dependent zinc metalloprotease FtsH, partial [Gaiellaceae bacterium]
STGAQNDLQQATALARRMVEEFGMSDIVGPVTLARPSLFLPTETGRAESLSSQVAADADTEIRRFIEEAEERAVTILTARRRDLDRLARLLLERETLERSELEAAISLQSEPRTPTRQRVAGRKMRSPKSIA